MSEGMEIEVEIVDLDNQSDDVSRTKRFLFNVRVFHCVSDSLPLRYSIFTDKCFVFVS